MIDGSPVEPRLTRSGMHPISPLFNQVGCEAKIEPMGRAPGNPCGVRKCRCRADTAATDHCQHDKMESATEKRAALPRAPRREVGWALRPVKCVWVIALRS